MVKLMVTIVFLVLVQSLSHGSYIVQQVYSPDSVQFTDVIPYRGQQLGTGEVLRDLPLFLIEGPGANTSLRYQEKLISEESATTIMKTMLNPVSENILPTETELRTIVSQGPTPNRIDLTFVGDGYTMAEKEKFFADVQRLTEDLFMHKAFSSYLPLFNVHAVFAPSIDSGITDLTTKNTVFGLYRSPKGSKRGILPGNMRAIDAALRLAPDTDYPIIVANDDFYGGLGGKYAITTRSLNSGAMVLRHELGHNFGNVGEEYDGGSVYQGANNSSVAQTTWRHWIDQLSVPVFEGRQIAGEYLWKNLQSGPAKISFQLPAGKGLLFDSIISAVGWSSPQDVSVRLNGQEMQLDGHFTVDRSFFKLSKLSQLSSGSHTLEFSERVKDGDNVLAFAMLYALPESIVTDKHYYGAYATFSDRGIKSYRPTFDTCLMRDMRSDEFCSVDLENMWKQFLKRISLIDGLDIDNQTKHVEVKAATLPGLQVRWFKNVGEQWVELESLSNMKVVDLSNQQGPFMVEVIFTSPQVRTANTHFKQSKTFKID